MRLCKDNVCCYCGSRSKSFVKFAVLWWAYYRLWQYESVKPARYQHFGQVGRIEGARKQLS